MYYINEIGLKEMFYYTDYDLEFLNLKVLEYYKFSKIDYLR
jgi:hypothetical protein